jgi:uncharacterized cupredoxin-like copper-binding protein
MGLAENLIYNRQVLRVACVEYGPDKVTTIQHVYETAVLPESIAVFIHAEVLGVLFATLTGMFMTAVNMTTEATVTIPVDLEHEFELDQVGLMCST